MELNDLLDKHGINPSTVLVMRHSPKEKELRRILPWLANEQPDVFNAYQQTQNPREEKKIQKARYVASFIGHEPGRAVFVGLYEVKDWRKIDVTALRKNPAHAELIKHGMNDAGPQRLWFDLTLSNLLSRWKGKLIIRWPPPELVWPRWAKGNQFEIEAILDESILVGKLPDWRDLVLTWDQLQLIPKRWKEELSRWRGVYFIWDSRDGKGYVGSAYGKDNLLGRWTNYAKTGHGGNKLLKSRKPQSFRFSILEWAAPDMEDRDIIERESGWKKRLHTRTPHGLNEN